MRSFARFFLSSLAGLLVDLGGFQLLVAFGVAPALANIVSSGASITLVYFLATRYTFGSRASLLTYTLFVSWYSANILVTSAGIALATGLLVPVPFLWKAVSVPISFTANYLFSLWLFRFRLRRGEVGPAEPDQP